MVSQFGSLGYTIIGKTADLTAVQKIIIDTLHKEGKQQKFIAKEAGCSQSAVSKHVNRKLSERKKCGRKRCTTNRENRGLERLPLLNHRQRQRHLTWAKEKKKWTAPQLPSPKSSFQMRASFVFHLKNQGPSVWGKGGEAHSPSCLKSSVKFPQSMMIWDAMSSAGVKPLCFKVTAPVYQEISEHFMPPSADQVFKDADFIFQQDLAPAHTAKNTKTNSPDLNPIENVWGIVKRKMRNKRPKNADKLKATVKETWASIPPQQCHRLITSMPRRIEACISSSCETEHKCGSFKILSVRGPQDGGMRGCSCLNQISGWDENARRFFHDSPREAEPSVPEEHIITVGQCKVIFACWSKTNENFPTGYSDL
ncbi:Transposable element Tc1 transposase [Labeo rohita]|uniref:Transposable element Tc1 transposase n=1 Tax=Labeo rohita TaxID=84645 RepID=A0ABQ8LQN3_LABRO|nr:Transposable element Tc1 transposase [Labeo rohita]